MDSLTQIVLGASVGEAVLGKKIGNKALLWGAVAGTIPDLDTFAKYCTDSLTANELHRGFSHSFVFSFIFAPIFGYALYKLYQKKNEASYKEWSVFMFWGLVTHPILDAFTTWGTQLFWPLDYKVSFKNIFVVDPLYTLPFLFCTVALMFYKRTNPKRRKWNRWGIGMSCTYMAITLLFKWYSFGKFEQSLTAQKIPYQSIQTKPSPLNSILWSANVMQSDSFKIGHYSLLDSKDDIPFKSYPKRLDLIESYKQHSIIKRLAKLTQGWYTISKEDGKLYFNDLRFGELGFANKENKFVFKYQLIFDESGDLIGAEVQDPNKESMMPLLKELGKRVKGN